MRLRELLGKVEFGGHFLGHHLRQKCALDQRPADRLDPMRGEQTRQCGGIDAKTFWRM